MVHTYDIQSLDLSCPPASDPEELNLEILPTTYESQAHEINKWAPDYQALMPMFGWLPADVIQQTFIREQQTLSLNIEVIFLKRDSWNLRFCFIFYFLSLTFVENFLSS